jgi:hypothetical protein
VLQELAALRFRRNLIKALRTNARYALLAALRGRVRLRAATSVSPIDRRLADVAVELARAADNPRFASWPALRDLVLAEWPDAHPLLAQ